MHLKLNATASLGDITNHLSWFLDEEISVPTTRRFLKRMGWSWKVPTRFQIQKYNTRNLLRYFNYLDGVQLIPMEKLKFADESHIVSKNLTKRKVLGVKSHRVYLKEHTLHHAHASITVMTSLTGAPIVYSYREETNTQWNFTDFVFYCCIEGHLLPGDYLIVDNAAVHCGHESSGTLEEILETWGVRLIFLPAYSPELNPCELVFSLMKTYLRNHRGRLHIRDETLAALEVVTKEHLRAWYHHCIYPKVILPELVL